MTLPPQWVLSLQMVAEVAHTRSVELRIRTLPNDVGRKLRAAAALRGQTFNSLLIELLTEAAERIGPEAPRPKR